MKKLLFGVLAVAMFVPAMFLLTACGGNDYKNGNGDENGGGDLPPPPPPPVQLSAPGNVHLLAGVLLWDEVIGAVSFDIRINSGELINVPTNPRAVNIGTYFVTDGVYIIEIRAVSSHGVAYHSTWAQTAHNNAPAHPRLPAPTNIRFTDTTTTDTILRWDATPGAIGYLVNIGGVEIPTVRTYISLLEHDFTLPNTYTVSIRALGNNTSHSDSHFSTPTEMHARVYHKSIDDLPMFAVPTLFNFAHAVGWQMANVNLVNISGFNAEIRRVSDGSFVRAETVRRTTGSTNSGFEFQFWGGILPVGEYIIVFQTISNNQLFLNSAWSEGIRYNVAQLETPVVTFDEATRTFSWTSYKPEGFRTPNLVYRGYRIWQGSRLMGVNLNTGARTHTIPSAELMPAGEVTFEIRAHGTGPFNAEGLSNINGVPTFFLASELGQLTITL